MITFTIANKTRPKATVLMIASFRSVQFKKSIGASLPARFWNAKKHRAKTTAEYDGSFVNSQIDIWENCGKKAISHFVNRLELPSSTEFLTYLNEVARNAQSDPDDDRILFCDYFEKIFLPRCSMVQNERICI